MSTGVSVAAFAVGAIVSLFTSWVLVSRLERVGERLGFSEALLGLVAALAADAPEITASVTALAHHQRAIGAGVVIGSNVFNLAALLGLGAVVAGRISLHRRVVALGGAVGIFVSIVCLTSVTRVLSPLAGLVVVLAVLAPYVALLSAPARVLGMARVPRHWSTWLSTAVAEEEVELSEAIRPRRATGGDALTALAALVIVVIASVAMERGASDLGSRYRVPEIVTGGLVLAAVTSLPNAVSAVYLARRGRGAAAFSTALNSNTINVVGGLLIPAAFIGLSRPSGSALLISAWYLGLTVVVIVLAHADNGLRRPSGWLIITAYAVFVVTLLATS
jgi:cation:H+ antiporter